MSNDLKEAGKVIASIALAASFIFPPAAAITVPMTAAATGIGAVVTGIGYATDDDKIKQVGIDVLEVAGGAVTNDPTGKACRCINKSLGIEK